MWNNFQLSDFEIDFNNPIFKGTVSSIYKSLDKNEKKEYAIKRISVSVFKEEEIISSINDMIIMNECENSTKFFGYFKDDNYFYIIMELCEFSLDKIINEKKGDIKELKEIIEQLNNALKIMQDNGIIHQNIKPENILIKKSENNKNIYKLTDYRLLKIFKENNNKETFEYIAPEIRNNLNDSKLKVDLWSIGIIIHKLYFGNTPKNNIIQKTKSNYLDDLIQNLIVEIPFDKNNICRINWEDYFNHIFFQNNYKKEIFYLNNSLDKFNGTINMMISFINKKYEEFKNLIHKEIENINTDEHNEKIGNFSALLNEFSFNEDKNKLSEIFRIFEKSIFNDKVIVENKVYIDNDIIYGEETMKGTNIKNGKGVEYKIKKDNLLVFKGEYLNGKRNGKGREYYDNNNLKYQGEYKEGKIWNGKGYDIKGKLEFEVKNGNGKGKEYKSDEKLLFEGEYWKGERNGNGKEYNNNGELLFEGEYLNDKKNGKAKEYYYNGKLKFEGEYLNDKKNGKAKEYGNINDAELRFEGFYKEGEKWNGKSYWEFKRRKIRRGNSYFYIGNIIFEREYLNGKENLLKL